MHVGSANMRESRIQDFAQQRDRSEGAKAGIYTQRSSFDEDELETYSYGKWNENLKKTWRRKPSTPDEKRKKQKINLFERNNVDYLVDHNAIHIENDAVSPERKTLPVDGLNISNVKSEKSKHKRATLGGAMH